MQRTDAQAQLFAARPVPTGSGMKSHRKALLGDLVPLRGVQGFHGKTAILLAGKRVEETSLAFACRAQRCRSGPRRRPPQRLAAQLATRPGTNAPDGLALQRNIHETPARANDKPSSLANGGRWFKHGAGDD